MPDNEKTRLPEIKIPEKGLDDLKGNNLPAFHNPPPPPPQPPPPPSKKED